MSSDLDELERLAEAVTAGPWQQAPEIQGVGPVIPRPSHMAIAYDIQRDMDSAYIAALSPDVVLELIAEVRRLRGVEEAAKEA